MFFEFKKVFRLNIYELTDEDQINSFGKKLIDKADLSH